MRYLNTILLLFIVTFSNGQGVPLRVEYKDQSLSESYYAELKRLTTQHRVEGAFGYVKTIIKNDRSEFDETTRLFYKVGGEVYDTLVEARFIPYSELKILSYDRSFSIDGQTHFYKGEAIACIFYSTKDEPLVMIKLLNDNPKDYGSRQYNNCYSESYIIPIEWWNQVKTWYTKNQLVTYLREHFQKTE